MWSWGMGGRECERTNFFRPLVNKLVQDQKWSCWRALSTETEEENPVLYGTSMRAAALRAAEEADAELASVLGWQHRHQKCCSETE